MQQLRAGFQLDQRGDRLAVAARAGQVGHRHRVHAAVAAKGQQGIDRAAFKGAVQRVAGLEGKAGRLVPVAGARAHPALFALTTTVTGSSTTCTSATAFFSAWISVRRASANCLGVGLDLLDHQAAQAGRVAQDVFELARLLAQFGFSSCSILMASSRASWRRRISRMSSAWRSLR
jgi:hypothetical protein